MATEILKSQLSRLVKEVKELVKKYQSLNQKKEKALMI
jgi:hypothetical protein